MILRYPIFLLLVLLIPAMVYLRYGGKRRPSIKFSDGAVLGRLPIGWGVYARKLLPVFYSMALVLLALALCRPQRGLQESRVRTEAVDIVAIIDVSTSMEALDFATPTREMNRLDAAKECLERFIKDRPNDRIALIAFAAMPYTASPLTLDHAWLIQRMQQLYTGMLEDRTAIGDAIASAINRLRESKAKSKVVILLTDGMNNWGKLSPINAAQSAKALGVKIYTVGAASDGLVRMPGYSFFGPNVARSQVDEATLKEVAQITGAAYFRAKDLDGLKKVYSEIDAMEKTEVEVEQYTRFEERFAPFLAMGLILLGLEKLLALTRLGTLP